jgi:arylformamidase
MDFKKGDHLGLSWIKTTLHIGAHADAPSHYHREGASIDQRDLSLYMGKAQVIDVRHVGPRRILPSDFDLASISVPRVLFKSGSFQHAEPFQTAFTSLSPELIEALAARGVRLLGIDTPSVDPADSKDLPSHQALYRHDFAVLEGIDLDQVPAGHWKLSALPLALAEADASPVRAVLWPLDFDW